DGLRAPTTATGALPPVASGADRLDAFLARAEQELTVLPVATPGDGRALVLAYRERYGPLGRISVLAGRRAGAHLTVDTWVLSCRAFSRRIEWATLAWLFDRWHLSDITFAYAPTP